MISPGDRLCSLWTPAPTRGLWVTWAVSLWLTGAGVATSTCGESRTWRGPNWWGWWGEVYVCGLIMRDRKSRSSCSIYQVTPVSSVVSQQQTGVSVTIHLSTRQSLQSKVVSLYIFLSSHLWTHKIIKRVFAYGNFAKNDEQTQERISAVLLRGDKNNRLYIPQT